MRATVVILCVLLVGGGALADEQKDAVWHVERGTYLFNAGDHRGALSEFEAAYQISKSWQVLIHIGVTQNRLGRYPEALATLERYLKEGGESIPSDQRAQVEKELGAIRALLVRVTLEVLGGAAEVHVDGKPVGTSPLSGPLLLGPGEHTFRATRARCVPAQKTVTMASGTSHTVVLKLEPETGVLRVESRPAGGRVSLGGRAVGQAPWEQRLPAERYRIIVALDGYREARREVVLDGGRLRELTITLEPLPRPPWYTRWYWWTAIGVVVTGGVVTAAVLATRPHYDVTLVVPGTP